MYDFRENYDVMPATEGVGDFFTTVLNKIAEAGKKIKDWADKVAYRIKQLTGRTTDKESLSESSEATKKIAEIGKNISAILSECCTCVDTLYAAYREVGRYKEVSGPVSTSELGKTRTVSETNDNGEITKSRDYTASYKAKGGMDKLDKDAQNDSKKMAAWNKTKEDVGLKFVTVKNKAEKISSDLKSLSKYGPLTLSATKQGYSELRDIFNANGKFGAEWKKIKIAAEWSTGDIKAALNKVVSLYDVGIRATDAFGRRLSSGNFRGEDGKAMDKDTLKNEKDIAKYQNKIYSANKSDRDITTSRKDKNFVQNQFAATKESALLERLYQMAYEDAMEDIATSQQAMEAFDSVPGAYEFVEEDVDEFAYDPDFDFAFIDV